ncbi:MAG: hypothetical protein AAFR23_10025, partial [Pseudomonadota bacterium]
MIELSPFEPVNLFVIAALNPIVAIVGVWMGYRSDSAKKLLIAGFAAALAGAAALWAFVYFGFVTARGIGGEAGVFAISIALGTLWAAFGYFALK